MAGIAYPLDYGTSTSGALTVRNQGSLPTPFVGTFHGPLTDPVAVTVGWSLGFDITLADGEALAVDTAAGTALLNGTADRLYLLRTDSDPLERCRLPTGRTDLSLTAAAGTGTLSVSFRDARM